MIHFKVLTVNDIKASTAIVNPNEPGSTQLKLSWIWQSASGHRYPTPALDHFIPEPEPI